MKALTFHGKHNIRHESVPDPGIMEAGDAIVRVKLCAICGSDLHVYHEHEKGLDHATVMGHEFMGEIVETGSAVRQLKRGDRVMSPFSTSCGRCFYCLRGLTSRCVSSQLFGWVEKGKGLHGAQAEYVRVPLGDSTLIKIPEGIKDEEALLLGDIIPTGYFCALQAAVKAKEVYAVIGCGPVGLMAIMGALEQGAEKIYAIDRVKERLAVAENFGAIPVDASVSDAVEVMRAATENRGADAVLEAVGNKVTGKLAYDLVRPGGVISMVGVCTEEQMSFSPVEAYNKNLTFKVGRCPARHLMPALSRIVRSGRYDVEEIISHRLTLSEGAHGYDIFAGKKDHCLKVVLSTF